MADAMPPITVECDCLLCSAELIPSDALVVAVVSQLKVADVYSERHSSIKLIILVCHMLA